jgi:Tfp pilus assembly protein PilZ
MTEERERRYSQRYQFPDSKVFCQEKTNFGLFKQYSNPFPLNDLTKSGLCFETDKNLSYGDKLNLKIDIPGQQRIHIIGQIRWSAAQRAGTKYKVGVQFLPFGTLKGYNSFHAREKLYRLISSQQTSVPEEEILQ